MTNNKQKFYFTLEKPVTLIEGAVVNPLSYQVGAIPNYYIMVGITDPQDCQTLYALGAQAFQSDLGIPFDWSAQQSNIKTGAMAADEALFYAQGKGDDKIKFAQTKADLLRPFPLVVKLNSKYAPALVRMQGDTQVEVKPEEREWADKELFYSGAKVYISGQLYGYRRKNMQSQDGLTGFIHGVMFHSHGEKLLTFSGHKNGTELFKGFSGVTTVNPTPQFGAAPQGFAPPAPPAAPQGFAPPAAPQGFAPPAAPQGFAPPAAPQGFAPPAAPAPMGGQSFPTGNFAPPQAPVAPAAPAVSQSIGGYPQPTF